MCEQIRHADVICLVFSVVDDASQQNIKDKWMPLFRECQLNNDVFHPIILVGNKSDLVNTVSLHVSLTLSIYACIFLQMCKYNNKFYLNIIFILYCQFLSLLKRFYLNTLKLNHMFK